MIVLILINVFIIIYIYYKYYGVTKEKTDIQTDELSQMNSLLLGYIYDEGIDNNYDMILSEIIQLSAKGYIEFHFNQRAGNRYDYVIRRAVDLDSKELLNYEIIVLGFLFSEKNEITKRELDDKIKNVFSSYNIQYNDLNMILYKDLKDKNLIDQDKVDFRRNARKYLKISVGIIVFISLLATIVHMENFLLNMTMYILEKIIIFTLLNNISILNRNGQKYKKAVIKYKKSLSNKEFLNERNEMSDVVRNKTFADSLVLHIDTQAKNAFADYEITDNAKKVSRKLMFDIIIYSTIILLVSLVVGQIAILLGKAVVFWVYLIFAIASACVVDIAYSRSKK